MIRPSIPVFTVLTGAMATLILAGCEKPQIRVYTVAKEVAPATPAPAAPASAMGGERPARPRAQVSYNLPAGWQETGASQMSLVNFTIKTDQGQATVNITPLAGMQGNEAAIVNMWRSQVGQPVLNDADVAKGFTPVEVAGSQAGQLFEVAGTNGSQPLRIVTAFDHRDGQTWFFKLQGDEQVVAAQKPAFLDFLKSVKIKEGEAATTSTNPPSAPPAPPTAGETEPAPTAAMVAPEGWQSVAPGQMQVAKFAVQTADGAKADVSVSVFPSDTGGTLANVNRWRRQLGMEATDEAGLQECVTPLDSAKIEGAPGAILADLTHENRRMLGAIVPRDGQYWFYKMMGDVAAVNAEKENFVHFAKSQP